MATSRYSVVLSLECITFYPKNGIPFCWGGEGAWGRGNGICLTPKMISLDAKFSHTQASHHRGLSYLFLTSSLKY